MADSSKFLKTWELPENSLLIRWYMFVWRGADEETITFCKLFWGILLSPFVPFVLIALSPLIGLLWISESLEDKSREKFRAEMEAKINGAWVEPPSKRSKALTWITETIDKVSAFFQSHPNIGKIVRKGFLYGGFTLLVAGAAALVSFLIYAGIAWTTGTVQALIIMTIIIGGLLAVGAIAYGIAYAVSNTWIGDASVKVGDFFCKIGRFFASGYYSVKYRSCPRVVITPKASR